MHPDYGLDGRPKVVKLDDEHVADDIVYNASGQIVSMVLGPSSGPRRTHERYSYYDSGLPMTLTLTRNGRDLIWTSYDYTKAGQLELQLDSNEANQRFYTYDSLGRLKTASSIAGLVHPSWSQTYEYDRYGNRTSTTAGIFILNGC
jgi:YD repeat-containing protein